MPIKTTHQRVPTETARLRGRTNTVISATTTKTGNSTWKRGGNGQNRQNSSLTMTSTSDAASMMPGNQMKKSIPPPTMKIITEVNGSRQQMLFPNTNVDEVLSLSDPSLLPSSFLTEIQEDEVYSTIWEELQKRFALHLQANPPEEELKIFSPHLFALQDDQNNDAEDDQSSLADEILSTASSEAHELPGQEVDYDTDIEPEPAPKEVHDPTGRTDYEKSCQKANLVPCSYFMAHIQDTELILRYHQFSTEDLREITKALRNNLHVEHLHLDGNYLQQQAAKHLTQLILENDSVSELSVADNRLGGGKGTKELCRMISLAQNLKRMNLSGNMFNEVDVIQLIEAFEKNKILSDLNLSHNCFGEGCGKALGNFLSGNYSLETLDLSWNRLRGKSAIDLLNGIKENTFLKRCNLEMNGFGPEGGACLAECIKHNGTLQELNVNGNRLNTPNAFAIGQALAVNTSLQVLKMANNEINSDGIIALLCCIKANEASALRELDLSHMVVTKDIRRICEDIAQLRGGKFIYHLGKELGDKLAPNALSECYLKTDQDFMKRIAKTAGYVAKEKKHQNWLSFTEDEDTSSKPNVDLKEE